jgi:hypothetical protein
MNPSQGRLGIWHAMQSLLRRLGLGVGAFMAAFYYYDPHMSSYNARMIGLGVGLVAFCLPRLGLPSADASARPARGFEVVVPGQRQD